MFRDGIEPSSTGLEPAARPLSYRNVVGRGCFHPFNSHCWAAPLTHEFQILHYGFDFVSLDRADAESRNDGIRTHVRLDPEMARKPGVAGKLVDLPDGRLIRTGQNNLGPAFVGEIG